MLCPECRTMNSEGSIFCEQCGIRFEQVGAQAPSNAYVKIHDLNDRGGNSTVRHNPGINQLSALRHPKESTYFTLGAIAGVIAWFGLIWIVILFIWVAIPVIISLWIADQFFKAKLMGNSVKVSKDQYPGIFEIVEKQSRLLKLDKTPEIFITNSEGSTNAVAIKLLKNKYIILRSGLVDVMLSHGTTDELSSIIGHEIGHHAAGHTTFWKKALLMPAMFLPLFGPAYSRACELTADRIGMFLCGNKDAACRGLMALACGSKLLSSKSNITAFIEQERHLPPLFAFFHDLYSSHPRTTKRVLALEDASHIAGLASNNS